MVLENNNTSSNDSTSNLDNINLNNDTTKNDEIIESKYILIYLSNLKRITKNISNVILLCCLNNINILDYKTKLDNNKLKKLFHFYNHKELKELIDNINDNFSNLMNITNFKTYIILIKKYNLVILLKYVYKYYSLMEIIEKNKKLFKNLIQE